MNWFNKLGIARKTTVLMMVVTLIVAMTILLGVVVQQVISGLAGVREEGTVLAGVMRMNSVAPLSFLDNEAAQQTLSTLVASPSVNRAYLYNQAGELVAKYATEDSTPSGLPAPHMRVTEDREITEFDLSELFIHEPIRSEGVLLGFLELHISLEKLYSSIAVTGGWIVGSLLLCVPLAYFLARYLQRPIITPLLDLVRAMDIVAKNQSYSVVVRKTNEDEIGTLVDGFNSMLVVLEEKNIRIVQKAVELEQKVRERTHDLENSNKSLTLAKDMAEASARAKADFLANMSHEIRTPMNGVLGASDLALSSASDQERIEYLHIIRSSAESLLSIINDILDFSKIDAGKLTLESVAFNLEEVVSGSLAACLPTAIKKGVIMIKEVQPSVPRFLLGDSVRIRQVLVNLIGNAVKFTETAGAVVVLAEAVGGGSEECRIRLSVNDTGVGIPADKTGQIFEAFSQADTSSTRKFGGTGLGLTICQRLVGLMGGVIEVRSTEGVGSSFHFTVTFPVVKQPPAVIAKSAEMPESESVPPLTVLLVEDNLTNQKIAKTMLLKLGHFVSVASNGQEGVHAFQSGRFDLVFMDCQMPVMDGFEATRAIRDYEASEFGKRERTVPIVALTAHAMEGDRERCIAGGMTDYITKPLSLSSLKDCLTRTYETCIRSE
jgi:signal transduction histidine kinase/ActR/RegA family two-component response regulator